jgi:ferritin-like protein
MHIDRLFIFNAWAVSVHLKEVCQDISEKLEDTKHKEVQEKFDLMIKTLEDFDEYLHSGAKELQDIPGYNKSSFNKLEN